MLIQATERTEKNSLIFRLIVFNSEWNESGIFVHCAKENEIFWLWNKLYRIAKEKKKKSATNFVSMVASIMTLAEWWALHLFLDNDLAQAIILC